MSRYLLDTHVAIWWADANPKLADRHRRVLEDESNEVFLSSVSVWEAAIKAAQGKLSLKSQPLSYFQRMIARYQFTVLAVQVSHAAGVHGLPKVHGDPFDRLLISQARSEGLTLLSDDAVFEKYDLPGLIGR